MSSLFLKYPKNTLVQIDTIPKVNISTVIRVVTSIVPPNSTPLNYKAVDDGYLLTFANEKSINLFFTPANIIKLKEFNLTPTLSPHSKNNREIYIPGVTKYIYYLPKDKIIAEIKQKNNIDCLIINLFTSTGGTRYLVITTDSRVSRDNVLKSSVKLLTLNLSRSQNYKPSSHNNSLHCDPTTLEAAELPCNSLHSFHNYGVKIDLKAALGATPPAQLMNSTG